MSNLTFPTLNKRSLISCEFSLITNTQSFTSPLTKSVQTSELPGAFWTAVLAFQNVNEVDGRTLKAFTAAMNGMAGRCDLWDMSHSTPSGPAGGVPTVNGANQVGKTLVIDGCTNSITNYMITGDMFSINGELKILTANCNTNSSGNTTLNFMPALRSSPADNTPLVVSSPVCTMGFPDDQQMKQFVMKENRLFNPILSFVERF